MRLTKIIIFIVMVMVLFSPVIWLLFQIYGTPGGEIIAGMKIKKYLKYKYPEQKLMIEDINYNGKNAEYYTNILDKDKKVFTIVEYDWNYNHLTDSRYSNGINESFEKLVRTKTHELLPSIDIVRNGILLIPQIKTKRFKYNAIEREDTG